MRKDGIKTKQKILTVCVRLFLEQGYRDTSIAQITEVAGITRGSFQNIFPTKDAVLIELVKTMFVGQFGMADVYKRQGYHGLCLFDRELVSPERRG